MKRGFQAARWSASSPFWRGWAFGLSWARRQANSHRTRCKDVKVVRAGAPIAPGHGGNLFGNKRFDGFTARIGHARPQRISGPPPFVYTHSQKATVANHDTDASSSSAGTSSSTAPRVSAVHPAMIGAGVVARFAQPLRQGFGARTGSHNKTIPGSCPRTGGARIGQDLFARGCPR